MTLGGFGAGGGGASSKKPSSDGLGGFTSGATNAPVKSGGGGNPIANVAKGGLSVIGKALNVLDFPRALTLAQLRGYGRVLQGDDLDIGEMGRQINRREGFGDVIKDAPLPGGINTKRFLGLVGDLATDPLTYLTFGVGSGVKAAALGTGKAAVKVTAEQAARDLIKKGLTEEANAVLRRKSVNALSRETAEEIGIRQGPTILRRKAVPGGDVAARTLSDLAAPITERAHSINLGGITHEAAKGLTPVERLRLKDAERASRLLAKGMHDQAKSRLGTYLRSPAAKNLNRDTIRNALEGVGSDPNAVELRSILDDVANQTSRLTGKKVPRIEDYLPHRMTDEAKEAVALAGPKRRSKSTAAVLSRSYKQGDEFLGQTLQDGTISEMNMIAEAKGLGAMFKDDPIQLVDNYIREMQRFAQRSGVIKQIGTKEAPLKTVAAPGSKKAAKAARKLEKALQDMDSHLAATQGSVVKLADQAGTKFDAAAKTKALARQSGSVTDLPPPEKLAEDALQNGGFTIDPGLATSPTEGVAVSLAGSEVVLTPNSLEELADAIKTHAAAAPEGVQVGAWVDDTTGKVYLDYSVVVPNRATAEKLGRENGQLAVYDIGRGEEIRLDQALPEEQAAAVKQTPLPTETPALKAEYKTRAADLSANLKTILGDIERLDQLAKQASAQGDAPMLSAINARKPALQRAKDELMAEARALQDQVRIALQPKLMESAPKFDHAVIAQNEQKLAEEIQGNLANLEQLREIVKVRQSDRLANELEARERAALLFDESARLKTEGDDDLSTALALHAVALKQEHDLNQAAGKLGRLRELSAQTKTVRDVKAMTDQGLMELSDGRFAEPWVADAVMRLEDATRPENIGRLIKTFDRVSGFWRASALLSPGFHERNFFGGMFNNFLAGINPTRYFDFATADKQFRKGGLEAIKDGEVRKAFEAAQRLGQYVGADISDVSRIAGFEEGGRIIGRQNPVFRTNFKVGQTVEKNLRMPLFIDTYIKTGGDEVAALDAVMTYHFDYEDLNRFERTVARRTFAFYTWTRKNLPLQLHNLLDQPGKYTAYLHLKRNIEQGTPEDEVTPPFFTRQMAIRLPFMSEGGRVYAMPELPFINADNALGTENVLASLNPVIKTPLEAVTNHKFFEQRSFKTGLEATPTGNLAQNATWGVLLNILLPLQGKAGLPRVYKGKDGSLLMSEHEIAKIESLMPLLGRMRRLAPSEQKYQDRALTSWMSFAFGISTRTLDEATIGGELQRQKTASTQAATLQKQIEGGTKLATDKQAKAQLKREQTASQFDSRPKSTSGGLYGR